MKIVVTGAAGFIASRVSSALLHRGHTVVGIDCLLPDSYDVELKARQFEWLRQHDRFSPLVHDLRRELPPESLSGVDVVYHAAAMPGLPASWKNLQTYIECNVTATGNVLQAMVADNVPRIVHASTSSVYGKVAVGSETSQIDPVSPYGVTKLAAEGLVRSFCLERGLSSSILRYFSVFGPGQRPDMAFNIFIKKLLAGEPVTVFGDGLAARRNTYVSDCVMATAEVIERAPSAPVFNVSGTEVASVLDVLRLLQGISGKEFRVEFLPARAGDQRLTDGDSSLLTESTGWSPRVSLRDGLADQFAWQADGCRAEFGAPLLDVLENAPNANNSGSTP